MSVSYAPRMRGRGGFSVVELLVALVLLAVGLASLGRAAFAVARLERNARLAQHVAAAVVARLDSVRVLPCGAAQAGEARGDGIRERWTVEPRGPRLALADSIDVPSRTALSRVVRVTTACVP